MLRSYGSFLGLGPLDKPVGGAANTTLAQEISTIADSFAAEAALVGLRGEGARVAAPEPDAAQGLRAALAGEAVAPPAVTHDALTHF